jgi:putative CocE/NonD family hydrolase
MRDGVLLNTKIFLPDHSVWGPGPYPAIVERTPYGIGRPDALPAEGFPEPVFYGYAYVQQDLRGRFYSEGVDRLFYDEGQDGYDAVEWIASQQWCNGKVGAYGGSARGIATYLMASENPPHLVACYVSVASANLYNDVVFDGGALRMVDSIMWAMERVEGLSIDHMKKVVPQSQWDLIPMLKEHCREILSQMHAYDSIDYPYRPVDSDLYMHLPLKYFDQSLSILQPWIDEILSHPEEDEFRNHLDVVEKIDVPIMHVGGWYDFFSRSTVDAFVKLLERGNQKLIIAPGTHFDLGALPYASFLRWFDYWLKDIDNGIMNEPAVTYYRLGADDWQNASNWVPEGSKYIKGYLHSNGVLNIIPCASGEEFDRYIYDPANPVLTYGGRNLMFTSGALDQRPVEKGRTDILLYRSEALGEDVEITGSIKIVLSVSSNCTDTDFTAKLIDVYPNGNATLVLDNIIRARYRESMEKPVLMQPGSIYRIKLNLGDISYVFKAGHRIQLDVSSSNFPKYDRNLNTGETLYTQTQFNIAENTIIHNSTHPSYVIFPIASHSPQWLLGDLDGNSRVDIVDISIVASAFHSVPGASVWNPVADANNDDIINILDVTIVARQYGSGA